MPFIFQKLSIPEVVLVKTRLHEDSRGFFIETYRQSEFEINGIDEKFVQDSHSRSVKNVVRGLHYQLPPKSQGKLVRCISGEIFDVAVDIREGSPTYGKWVSAILSQQNHDELYIPPGFAHGFCVISEEAEIIYKQTSEYAPDLERGILWNDPFINIAWPTDSPIISDRDNGFPLLNTK